MTRKPPSPVVEEAEVAVVGAGPAGGACAALLAERGRDVVLVDQAAFPRAKACGDGLTRSTVAFLSRLGLEGLSSASHRVEGGRLVVNHSREFVKRFSPQPGRPRYGLCLPRLRLDELIVRAALDRGARLVQARAMALTDGEDGNVRAVQATQGEATVAIRARYVVAADGATSRLRRLSFDAPPQAGGYAARAYYRSEQPLDPLFDIYLPLRHGGQPVPGYGWVFPIEPDLANVGVAWFGSGPSAEHVRIRELLDGFARDLENRGRRRFGALRRLDRVLGAPLAARFATERCQAGNVLFCGDAANTVDPLTAEGIAQALHGAELVAGRLEKAIRRGARTEDAGAALARRFPRCGQNPWAVMRIGRHRAGTDGVRAIDPLGEPFVATIAGIAAKPDEEPGLQGTPVFELAERTGPPFAEALETFNEHALDALRTSFPFVGESIHREMRSGCGPVWAALSLFTAVALGERVRPEQLSAALAVELLVALPAIVSQFSPREDGPGTGLNNGLAVLATDFAHTRALRAAGCAGLEAMRGLARATCLLCEGQMLEREDLGSLDRSVERYLAAADARSGECGALATRLGAHPAAEPAQLRALGVAGRDAGVAFQICADVLDLLAGDHVTSREPGSQLRRGIHTLPGILSLRERPDARALLEEGEIDAALAVIRDAGGVELAVAACRSRAGAARNALRMLPEPARAPLEALAELAPGIAAAAGSRPPGTALEHVADFAALSSPAT
jgi:menaquinone-9 beta-reductase